MSPYGSVARWAATSFKVASVDVVMLSAIESTVAMSPLIGVVVPPKSYSLPTYGAPLAAGRRGRDDEYARRGQRLARERGGEPAPEFHARPPQEFVVTTRIC